MSSFRALNVLRQSTNRNGSCSQFGLGSLVTPWPTSRRGYHLHSYQGLQLLQSLDIPVRPFEVILPGQEGQAGEIARKALKEWKRESGIQVKLEVSVLGEGKRYLEEGKAIKIGEDGVKKAAFTETNGEERMGAGWVQNDPTQIQSLATALLSQSSLSSSNKPTHFILPERYQPTGFDRPISAISLHPSSTKSTSRSRARFLLYPDRSLGCAAIVGSKLTPNQHDPDVLPSLQIPKQPGKPQLQDGVYRLPLYLKDSDEDVRRQLAELLANVEFAGSGLSEAVESLWKIYDRVWKGKEGERLEFVLEETADGKVEASFPTFAFDNFSVHRQPDLFKLLDTTQTHPSELELAKWGMVYIKLPPQLDPKTNKLVKGDIGCFGYGAGLAMATADAVRYQGGIPANFLDGGGGASAENGYKGLKVLTLDPEVRCIFVNIYAGITRSNLAAEGFVKALREIGEERKKQGKEELPVVMRIRGNMSEEANEVMKKSGLKIITNTDFSEAARLAVEAAASVRIKEIRDD